jgi:hypothetical protein
MPDDLLVAIGYTSGSTGTAEAESEDLGRVPRQHGAEPGGSADLLDHDCGDSAGSQRCRRSTCTAWRCRCCCPAGPVAVHGARPFFPPTSTLRCTMRPRAAAGHHAGAPARAGRIRCAASRACAAIVSATAPLSRELALAAETRFGCEVREVFGSTETCVIARRRTAHEMRGRRCPACS